MDTLFAFAEVSDPISGGAGWVGAGLLSMVLGWLLLKHLPDKDKQYSDLVKAKDAAVEFIVTAFRNEAKEQRQADREALDKICQQFKAESTAERESCRSHFEALARSIQALGRKTGRD